MLVAELAGELPPSVALAVRQHIESCESCGVRAQAMARSYDLLDSLGTMPVPAIPDLRRPVRERLRRRPPGVRLWRAFRALGRGGIAGGLILIASVILALLFVLVGALRGSVSVGPSVNGLTTVPAAGSGGVLFAETGKALDVMDASGRSWPVAEVIVVDQRTGHVVRSLPTGSDSLRVGRTDEMPAAVAVTNDSSTIYELSTAQRGDQALIAIDASTGSLRFVVPLVLPNGNPLPSTVKALALAPAPYGQQVYVSLGADGGGLANPRVLVVDGGAGTITGSFAPDFPASVPVPPDTTASLPGVIGPPENHAFATTGLSTRTAVGGTLALSPDGLWLFDATTFLDAAGRQTLVVRRISTGTGTTAQALALPGDFTLSDFAASANLADPLLYLARAGSDAQLYILSTTTDGPTLLGQVPLGGPAALPGTVFTGQIAISPSASGGQVYVSADVSADSGQIQSHDIWLVDGVATTIVAHRVAFTSAGQILANWTGGAAAHEFMLQGPQVVLLPSDLAPSAGSPLWLSLKDGVPVTQLLGTGQ